MLNESVFRWSGVVADALSIVGPAAKERDIALSGEPVGPDEPHLKADALALRQVAINIFGNAVKFSPRGGAVSWRLDFSDGAELRIADNGPGIDARDLPYVFEPFRRGRAQIGDKLPPGAGVGLSLCRTLLQAHGGEIAIESDPGKGAVVTLFLPHARVGVPPPPEAAPAG